MKRLSNMKLSTKIMGLGLVVALLMAGMYVYLVPYFGKRIYQEKQLKTRHVVEEAASLLQHFVNLEKSGAMTHEAAQEAAKQAVAGLRYEKNDYFWINDYQPNMIMHPMKPELDGTSLAQNKDPNGKYLFVEMAKVVKAQGAGFVDYDWPKPGESKPVPKVSYVQGISDWQWIVGSGIYVDDVSKEVNRLTLTIGLIVLGVFVLALVLSWLMAKSLTKPLLRAMDNLTAGSEQVNAAASSLNEASQNLAEGASEQAATVQETSAALEQMTSMTHQTNQLTRDTEGLMSDNLKKSNESLAAVVGINERMAKIEADSGQMGKIIKNIDDIAFQTNLLALNAAVEAARAGEAGAGFAVVADEVRNLAQRAAQAARETQELLDGTIKRIGDSAREIKDMNLNFEEIVSSAKKMGEKIEAISQASLEQSKGIEQINSAATEIDRVTQRLAASAEEAAATSEELDAQAVSMMDIIEQVNVMVMGTDQAPLRGHVERRPQYRLTESPRKSLQSPKPKKAETKAQTAPVKSLPKPEDAIPMDDDFKDF